MPLPPPPLLLLLLPPLLLLPLLLLLLLLWAAAAAHGALAGADAISSSTASRHPIIASLQSSQVLLRPHERTEPECNESMDAKDRRDLFITFSAWLVKVSGAFYFKWVDWRAFLRPFGAYLRPLGAISEACWRSFWGPFGGVLEVFGLGFSSACLNFKGFDSDFVECGECALDVANLSTRYGSE
jgi:hypothetical protein